MRITPGIIQSELIGVQAMVVKSPNVNYMGLAGKVIDESKNTLTILDESKSKKLVKDSCIFNFTMNDNTVVEIDGSLLVGRPEDRLKKTIKRLW
jgi:ribonuclease P protein subunit POP4